VPSLFVLALFIKDVHKYNTLMIERFFFKKKPGLNARASSTDQLTRLGPRDLGTKIFSLKSENSISYPTTNFKIHL
jgi:hypothetical protein